MSCLSFHFHQMCHELGALSVSRSSCSALALHPNQTDVTGSQVFLRWGVTVPGTKSSGPSFPRPELLEHNHPLHAAMGKEVKSELKQQCVSNSINVIIHYLITEMVSHCSGRLGETDRPEPGFCLTEQHQRWGFDEWQLNLVR